MTRGGRPRPWSRPAARRELRACPTERSLDRLGEPRAEAARLLRPGGQTLQHDGDPLLDMLIGAVFTIFSWSSLAVVLLSALGYWTYRQVEGSLREIRADRVLSAFMLHHLPADQQHAAPALLLAPRARLRLRSTTIS